MIGWNLRIKKTPADTRVAECINADAGTGASIESGNQIWNPNWADFIKADIIKQKPKHSVAEKEVLSVLILV